MLPNLTLEWILLNENFYFFQWSFNQIESLFQKFRFSDFHLKSLLAEPLQIIDLNNGFGICNNSIP